MTGFADDGTPYSEIGQHPNKYSQQNTPDHPTVRWEMDIRKY